MKVTTEEFIEKAKEVHGNKYDYSKVKYVNSKTKVCIICPEHGEFWQSPEHHVLRKQRCCFCSNQSFKYTTNEFINKAKEIHGNKYDYSKVEYKDSHTKICVICPEHGEFWQRPYSHLQGQGCTECNDGKLGRNNKLTTEEFLYKARVVHGDKYDYSKVEYVNSRTKVCIICPEHGEFWQTPNDHLNSHGCHKCGLKRNVGELSLYNRLVITFPNEKIIHGYRNLKLLGLKSLDFYLPDYNIAIELQGRQHFEPVDYFGGENEFKKQVLRDNEKKKICEYNGIKLLYFYNDKKHKVCNINENINIIRDYDILTERINDIICNCQK